jgi:hypothetical protein
MKKKKLKKKLLSEIEWIIERDKQFCIRNEMEPTMYMNGVKDTAKKLKKIIKKNI